MKARTEIGDGIIIAKRVRGRRGRQDIILSILKTAEHGSRITKMISKVKLSTTQCNMYLERLKEANYISRQNGIWTTTERGLQVLDACRVCHALMNEI